MASQNTNENKTQDIIVILDESGSMQSMGMEPVQAINAFIKEQQKTLGDDGSTFSLWKFNTTVTKLIDDQNLHDVKEFTDYVPDSCTALLDAIGHAITTKRKKEKHNNVVVVILTDGHENSSSDYTPEKIRKLTAEMEKDHNWKFIYLGANQDAFATGGGYGVSIARCANFECATPGDLTQVTRGVSAMVSAYRSTSSQNPNAQIDLDLGDIGAKRTTHRRATALLSAPPLRRQVAGRIRPLDGCLAVDPWRQDSDK